MNEKHHTELAHTPGTWAACSEECIFDGTPYIAAEDGHGLILCTINHSGKGNYEGQLGDPLSDAQLMAAAPELLEVAQIAMNQCDRCECVDGQPLCLRCLAYHAVVKARGYGE